MKIVCLLAWYEERPEALSTLISSLRRLHSELAVVALDGAYALLPAGQPESDRDQRHAIRFACEDIGANYSITAPETVWQGNETEKRTELFRLGLEMADEGDWFLVVDADEAIEFAPGDFPERLAAFDEEVAEATLHEPNPRPGTAESQPLRMLFKAQPLTVGITHYTYVTEDGRHVWGPDKYALEPAADLTDLVITHRPGERSRWRRAQQMTYYAARKCARAEIGKCERCDDEATRRVLYDLRPRPNGSGLTGGFQAVCEYHAIDVKQENKEALERQGLGMDGRPDPRLAARA